MSTYLQALLLSGSPEYPSHTRTILEFVSSLLRERGVSAHLWDLHPDAIPIVNPIYYANPHLNGSEAVRRLARLAHEADAFVLATPVYYSSFSGVFKNALDNLNADQFHHKPVALISTGGGKHNGAQPLDHLQTVIHNLHGVVIPTLVIATSGDFESSEKGYTLVDETIQKRLILMTNELMALANLMCQLRTPQKEQLSAP